MTDLIVKVVLCMIVPILLLSGLLEKKSRFLVLSLGAGCIACMAAYYLNTFLYRITDCSYYHLTTSIAPFIEESLKFIPVFLFAKLISDDRSRLLPAAFAVGIGFSIVENSLMLAENAASSTAAWMLVRGIGTGLMHGMSTAIVGAGIRLASKDRQMAFTGTLAALFLAMMYHGAYNAMIRTDVIKYFGICLPLLSYGAVLILMNREKILTFLRE